MLITNPISFVAVTVAVALAVSFIYLLLTKYRIWEYLQVHADGWLEKLTKRRSFFLNEYFSCVFWLSFTLAMIICVILWCATKDATYVLIPFCSTPLSRKWS